MSVWEIIIKRPLGKLTFTNPLAAALVRHQAAGMHVLDIRVEHTLAVEQFPMIHKDPFDRMLIAQASVEQAVLVSADRVFDQYPVRRIW